MIGTPAAIALPDDRPIEPFRAMAIGQLAHALAAQGRAA
jgi:hypothetical protein